MHTTRKYSHHLRCPTTLQVVKHMQQRKFLACKLTGKPKGGAMNITVISSITLVGLAPCFGAIVDMASSLMLILPGLFCLFFVHEERASPA